MTQDQKNYMLHYLWKHLKQLQGYNNVEDEIKATEETIKLIRETEAVTK